MIQASLLGIGLFLVILLGVSFVRIVQGPSLYDRLLGVGVIGTNAVILLAVIGFIYGRPEGFLDLAITYAILNFIGVVAIAKFLEGKRFEDRGGDPGATREEGA
jgi:multicomponent Na+:H+ antiporter subunit F